MTGEAARKFEKHKHIVCSKQQKETQEKAKENKKNKRTYCTCDHVCQNSQDQNGASGDSNMRNFGVG